MEEKVKEKNQLAFFEKLDNDNYVSRADEYTFSRLSENLSNITLFHIQEISFEGDEKTPRREAFENVLGTIKEEGANFIYLILGNQKGVSFYFGIVRDMKENRDLSMPISEMGDVYLKSSIHGNFRGSKIKKLTPVENLEVLERLQNSKRFGEITGIPGINETSDNSNFQGVDRLIDMMLGDEFGLCIIAKPIADEKIQEIESRLYDIYKVLSCNSKQSVQQGVNSSDSSGTSSGTSTSTTVGKSTTTGSSTTKSANKSSGKNVTIGESKGSSTSSSKGSSISETKGKNTSETTGKNISHNDKSTGKGDGESKSQTHGDNRSITTGSNNSVTEGTNSGTSKSYGKNSSNSWSKSSGTSESKGTSTSDTKGSNDSITENKSIGASVTVSMEIMNKKVQDWLTYLDEILFPMLDYGRSKGIYLTNAFIFSNNRGVISKLGNTMRSLFSGRKGNKMPLKLHMLEEDDKRIEYFKNLQVPETNDLVLNEVDKTALVLRSNFLWNNYLEFGNWYSPNELSLIAGLPQKEVVGLSLKEEVEFGLNVCKNEKAEEIVLGNLVQSGNELDIEVGIKKKDLNKHVFVTGVTGTGKTTTCQKLLLETQDPFLVIEPAKTEYRILIDKEETKDLLVFTLGKDTVCPFRLNPFEFYPHESITSRVDMIKAAIEASFDMEAAIPQLIESSIYECYKDYGWDIITNKNRLFKDPFKKGVYAFPTLSDLINKTESEVVKQGFDERLKKDYIGSIKARLLGLTVGSKGMMLNVGRGIDFRELVEKKVVLEIEEIKNGNEKSLIMGFILTNLVEALKAKYRETRNFRHITLVEEAHRLLSKYEPGDSPNRKQGVETFADIIAEVRKYGESLIIADQIPNKLTPEVIKNTNTKIVHKILAADDKNVIGNTMALTDEQKQFLSSLTTGRAIIFSQGWEKALQVQIKMGTNTTGDRYVEDYELQERVINFYKDREIIPGLKYIHENPTIEEFEFCKNFCANQKNIKTYKELFENKVTNYEEFKKIVRFIEAGCNEDMLKFLKKEEESIYDKDLFVRNIQQLCKEFPLDEVLSIIRKTYYSGSPLEDDAIKLLEEYLLKIISITGEEPGKQFVEIFGNTSDRSVGYNRRAILKKNLIL